MTDQTELEVIDQKPSPLVIAGKSDSELMMDMFERLMTNPEVDPVKIKAFVDMREHEQDRTAEQAFNVAMCQAQKAMPIVPKDAHNGQTNSDYTRFETLLKWTKPVYTQQGFSMMFYEGDTDKKDNIRLMVDVMHDAGHCKIRFLDVPMDTTGMKGTVNKTNTHGKVSSVSYGKSTLMRMIFNIPTGQDDDGNAAGAHAQQATQILPPTTEEDAVITEIFKTLMNDPAPEGVMLCRPSLEQWLWACTKSYPAADVIPKVVAFIRSKMEAGTPLPIYEPEGI